MDGHETQHEPKTNVGEETHANDSPKSPTPNEKQSIPISREKNKTALPYKPFVDLDSESESTNDYDSAEDSPYRLPFHVDETDSEEDMRMKVAANKKGMRKEVKSLRKKGKGKSLVKKDKEKSPTKKGGEIGYEEEECKITCKL